MGWIDTDKLDKIIYNLLSNAAKYSHEDGEVTLKVQTNKTFDHIRIEVSDTGDGIPPEKMKNLFHRFHDGEYRKHRTIGTGLGLYLTHDLVYLHHGTIHCESEVGKGTTFTVELPINKESFAPDQIDETRTIDFNIPKTPSLTSRHSRSMSMKKKMIRRTIPTRTSTVCSSSKTMPNSSCSCASC